MKLSLQAKGQCYRSYRSPLTPSATNELRFGFKLDAAPTSDSDMLLVLMQQSAKVCRNLNKCIDKIWCTWVHRSFIVPKALNICKKHFSKLCKKKSSLKKAHSCGKICIKNAHFWKLFICDIFKTVILLQIEKLISDNGNWYFYMHELKKNL